MFEKNEKYLGKMLIVEINFFKCQEMSRLDNILLEDTKIRDNSLGQKYKI
jgi:hypothetical protein